MMEQCVTRKIELKKRSYFGIHEFQIVDINVHEFIHNGEFIRQEVDKKKNTLSLYDSYSFKWTELIYCKHCGQVVK